MQLVINGEERTFDDGATILQIITQLGIIDKIMACALNMQIVQKDYWEVCQPKNGDVIELLEFVGGG